MREVDSADRRIRMDPRDYVQDAASSEPEKPSFSPKLTKSVKEIRVVFQHEI